MRVFIERFVLGILAPVVVLLAFTNPMEWDWAARGVGIAVSIIVAGIASYFSGWDALHWERLRSLWWLWLIIGLSGGSALSPLFVKPPISDLIQGYGETQGSLFAIVASAPLLKYKDHFKMMLIIEVPYADIDKMTDTAIEKSGLYTITGEVTQMAVTSIKNLRLGIPAGSTGNVIKPLVNFFLAIIPNDVASEQIKTLSDVARVNGKMIGPGHGMNPEFEVSPAGTPVPAPAPPPKS
jgi:hypothetical protein